MKDLMIEEYNNRIDGLIAKEIGLTEEELLSVDYSIDDLMNNDGLLYGYQITFPDTTSKEILNKVRNLRDYSAFVDLHVIESADNFYEFDFDELTSTSNQYEQFINEISELKELLTVKTTTTRQQHILLRQIYISVFATLETYLSDTFIWLVRNDTRYLRAFVETYPDFKERKFDLSEVFKSHEAIKDTATKVMQDVIYHNFWRVKLMYINTFKIEFPDLGGMTKYTTTRHDLVHRNGKSKDGKPVIITNRLVNDLIADTSDFVKKISQQLPVDDGLPF